MGIKYQELFERNYGVFTNEEQELIRNGRVGIIGCGGSGGSVAVELARSGVENFVLYDSDIYTEANMNRQIACYTDTLGMNKAEVVAHEIGRISPDCKVEVHSREFEIAEMSELVSKCDIIVPAADDWALSMTVLAKAKELGKPAILNYPVGAFCRVSTFMPDSPYAQECMVIPRELSYDEVRSFMEDPRNRAIMHYYIGKGGWTQEWFDAWVNNEKPHAQICPVVWMASSLAVMEILKVLTGKWDGVIAPRYWEITPNGAKIGKFSASRRLLARFIQKPGAEKMIAWLAQRPKLVAAFTKAIDR